MKTLNLSFPLGQTLVLALLILALTAGVGEIAARLLLDPLDLWTAVGSDNPYFDEKIGALDRLVDQGGEVECILLGSSVVLNGLDPAIISAAYRDQTGMDLTCYNFGIPALTAQAAGPIAEVLVDRYHPRLLVYGFTLRALGENVSQGAQVYQGIVEMPWFQYRQGSGGWLGWLIDHSTAFRVYLAQRDWMKDTFSTGYLTQADGYEPFHGDGSLDPSLIEPFEFFTDYVSLPDAAAGLETLIQLRGRTQVLLLEMPLPEFIRAMFKGGVDAYQGVFDAIEAQHTVPLWSISRLDLIPDEGWARDGFHVNKSGARILSRWLGEQIAGSDLVARP